MEFTENKRVLILSPGPQSRLVDEFKKLKFECDVIAPDRFYCYLSNINGHDRLYLKGNEADRENKRIRLREFCAIVPRISGAGFEYGKLIVRHISENLGIFTTSSEFGLSICSNKFETCQLLSKHRIRVPTQILAHNLSDYKETIKEVGGFPFILKLQKGSQGAGIFLIRDETEASQTLRALQYSKMDLVLSQKLDSGKIANDLRVWVIGAMTGNPKLFAYKRFALSDDFRSNYSLSGSGEKVTLSEEEKDLAVRAAIALKMDVAGVDIMRHLPNIEIPNITVPYVIEVNGNPGLAGIEAVTEKNIAGEVAEFVVNNYKKGNVWDKKILRNFDITDAKYLDYCTNQAFINLKDINYLKSKSYIEKITEHVKRFLPETGLKN